MDDEAVSLARQETLRYQVVNTVQKVPPRVLGVEAVRVAKRHRELRVEPFEYLIQGCV